VARKLLLTGSSIAQREVSMNHHRRSKIPLAVASIALLACTLAFASPAGAQTAVRKFGRGLAEMTTGVLELPGNTVVETEKRGAVGVPIGVAKGLGMIVSRELVGVYEFVSAPFPVPAGYEPPLSPEFPWGYFDRAPAHARSEHRSAARG
jgi:putative exosortase-associated protein (TIGR04073 family)